MAGKRKAGDDIPGARHRAARTETTAGDDIAGTSAQTAGPTATAAGDGTAGTSQALAGPTAATTRCAVGYPGGASSQSGGARGGGAWSGQSGSAPPHRKALAGHTASTPAFAVGYPGGSSQFGGAAGGGFSLSHSRAPTTPMLRPPLGNPAVGSAPFPYQYHAPTGYDFFPGQNQIAGPWQTGTGQPRGDSGRIICHAPLPLCILCGARTTWVLGSAPLCKDCYNDYLLANSVLQQHPQMGYAGQQRQLDLRLPRPSSAAPGQQPSPPAPVAVGPRPRAPGAQRCPVCHAPTTRVLGLEPPREDEVCHDYLLAQRASAAPADGLRDPDSSPRLCQFFF
ncbi:formin-like protein 7 [Triticum aestivum]|uniref:formin-like protein 7 n=1 Tax=Triticum aestivum TaxID=4565 RepID=UPI001D02419F|nr:formin-like protein 7 [Triticum aestivum]